MKKLRSYQVSTLETLNGNVSGLVASGLGSGKTLVGAERMRHIEGVPRVLVVAPLNTHDQWVSTISEQFPSLMETPYLRKVGTPKADPESWKMITGKQPGVYIIGWEAATGDIPLRVRKAHSTKGKKDPGVTLSAIRAAAKEGLVPPWSRSGTWSLVIADECHRMSNRNTATKKVIAQIKTEKKLALSATAAGNRPEGLWSTLNWLWPQQYGSYWKWVDNWMILEETNFGQENSIKVIVGERDPGETWKDIPCAVRYRTEDIAVQLPEVIDRVVTVKMGEQQRRIYDEFEEQSLAWLDDQPVEAALPLVQRIRLRQAALGQLSVSESVRLIDYTLSKPEQKIMEAWNEYRRLHAGAGQQEFLDFLNENLSEKRKVSPARFLKALEKSAMLSRGIESEEIVLDELDIDFAERGDQPKLKAIKEILRDLPDSEPVIIYTHSAKWARMAAAHIDGSGIYGEVRAWTGDLTPKQRDGLRVTFGKLKQRTMKSVFTHEGIRVLVAVIPAVAEGIDGWQNVCRCEIWASPSEDGLKNEQAKGRLHRPGQKSPVQRWRLHSEDSIDTDVAATLERRRKQMRAMYRDDKEQPCTT